MRPAASACTSPLNSAVIVSMDNTDDIASHSRLAVQAQPPAAFAAGQPDRQAVTRDRSAQRDDDEARRGVAANDSSVITLSFASTCQIGPQIACRRPPFAPFEQR